MERTSIYMLAEQAISEIEIHSDEDVRRVNLIYASAVLFLDGGIIAWYKNLSSLGAIQTEKTRDALIRRKLSDLFKVPWLIPIYSWKRGLSPDLTASLLPIIPQNNTILKAIVLPSEVDPYHDFLDPHFIRGLPPDGVRLMGIALLPAGIQIDEWPYDFSKGNDANDAYMGACSAVIEMGGKNLKNVPYGGLMHFSNTYLCPYGMNRLSNMWNMAVRDSTDHSQMITKWFELTPYEEAPVLIRIKALATWDTWKDAEKTIESLHHNVLNLLAATHYPERPMHESDALPIEPPLIHLASREPRKGEGKWDGLLGELSPTYMFEPRPIAKRTKNASEKDGFRLGLLLSFYMETADLKPGHILDTTLVREFERILGEAKGKTWKELVQQLASVKMSKEYDPGRIDRITKRLLRMRATQSLLVRQQLLKLILKDLKFDPNTHQYADAVSGIVLACEHTIEELTMLANEPSDKIKGIIARKYATGHISGEEDEDLPIIVACMYCGMDLGSDWLITVYERGDDVKLIQLDYTSDEFGAIIVKLVGSGAVSTALQPVPLVVAVHRLIGSGIRGEEKKLKRSADRLAKSQFLSLAGVVAALMALSRAGAPITINRDVLEAYIAKEYFNLLPIFELTPKTAIDRMVKTWDWSLSKYFTDPVKVINNTVRELMGISKDAVLIEYIRRITLSPTFIDGKPVDEKTLMAANVPNTIKQYYKSFTNPLPTPSIQGASRNEDNRMHYRRISISDKQLRTRMSAPTKFFPLSQQADIDKDTINEAARLYCPEARGLGKSGERSSSSSPPFSVHPMGGESQNDVEWFPLLSETELKYHDYEKRNGEGEGASWVCKRCGYVRNQPASKEYLEKYQSIFRVQWISTGPETRSATWTIGELARIDELLDEGIDSKLLSEFVTRFQWYPSISPSASLAQEMSHAVARLGHYSIGKKISGGDRNAICTGWNLIMRWCLKQSIPIARRLILMLSLAGI